jgi:hypothetical protein
MTDHAQRIVSDYLAAVDNAARDLPPDRRVELVTDLAEHIAAARVELAPETEAGVREVLDLPRRPARDRRRSQSPARPTTGRAGAGPGHGAGGRRPRHSAAATTGPLAGPGSSRRRTTACPDLEGRHLADRGDRGCVHRDAGHVLHRRRGIRAER